MLMTEDEYLLAQCCQHGIDPNSKANLKKGKDAEKIFDCPEVTPAGIFEPPETESITKIHNAKTKHNKASANFTHYAHTNLTCVLDIIDATADAIVTHLFPDNKDTN